MRLLSFLVPSLWSEKKHSRSRMTAKCYVLHIFFKKTMIVNANAIINQPCLNGYLHSLN